MNRSSSTRAPASCRDRRQQARRNDIARTVRAPVTECAAGTATPSGGGQRRGVGDLAHPHLRARAGRRDALVQPARAHPSHGCAGPGLGRQLVSVGRPDQSADPRRVGAHRRPGRARHAGQRGDRNHDRLVLVATARANNCWRSSSTSVRAADHRRRLLLLSLYGPTRSGSTGQEVAVFLAFLFVTLRSSSER